MLKRILIFALFGLTAAILISFAEIKFIPHANAETIYKTQITALLSEKTYIDKKINIRKNM